MTPAMMLRNTSASVLIGAIHTSDGMANVASFFEAGVDVVNFAALLSYDSSNINKVLIGGTRQTNWFNEHDLAGSALRYLPSDYDQELGNKLFAVDVFPEGYCSDPDYSSQWCIEYSRLALNPVISKLKDTPAYIYPALGERIYSVAATDTGPSQFETLPVRYLGFDFQGPCAQQFNGLRCRSGVLGYSLPCDEACTSCGFDIWEDSPYGYILDPLLECSDTDNGGSQIYCKNDELMVYNYDNCQDKNCQIITYPAPISDDGEDENILCFFAGTKDNCVVDLDLKFESCNNEEHDGLHPMFQPNNEMGRTLPSDLLNKLSLINQRLTLF